MPLDPATKAVIDMMTEWFHARPFEKAERFNDFRKMFDKLGKNIDAVTISCPDHMHAVATMMAIKAGAPIVPVAISGGRAAMVKGSFIIRPVTLTVRIGQPIETRNITVEDRDALIARVRQEIATLLALGPL